MSFKLVVTANPLGSPSGTASVDGNVKQFVALCAEAIVVQQRKLRWQEPCQYGKTYFSRAHSQIHLLRVPFMRSRINSTVIRVGGPMYRVLECADAVRCYICKVLPDKWTGSVRALQAM